MNRLICVGNDHYRNFEYVLDVLNSEKPDILAVEFELYWPEFTSPWSVQRERKIERGIAKLSFNQTNEISPKIYLSGICVFSEDYPAQGTDEARAAVVYALKNGISVFFVDAPFFYCPNFSRGVRERGIVGFKNGENPNYRIVLTDSPLPREEISKLNLRRRNLFMAGAAKKLEELYHPSVFASVGGKLHYFIKSDDHGNPDLEKEIEFGYGPKFFLQSLINANEKRVYNADEKRRII